MGESKDNMHIIHRAAVSELGDRNSVYSNRECEPSLLSWCKEIVDEVLVIRLANNPRYVYASKDGERISVEVPMWMSPRLPGKTIKVVKNQDSEHYSLAPADGN